MGHVESDSIPSYAHKYKVIFRIYLIFMFDCAVVICLLYLTLILVNLCNPVSKLAHEGVFCVI